MPTGFDLRSATLTALVAIGFGGALHYGAGVAHARAAQRETAGPRPVAQAAPKVWRVDEVVSHYRAVGTGDLVERMVAVPEPGDVVRVSDRVVRADGYVTLDRAVVRRVDRPVLLLRSSVDTAFTFDGSAGNGAEAGYENAFGATYEWENPQDAPAEIRFVFPSPSTGADVRGFSLKVGNDEIREPSANGAYVWKGIVPARAKVVASVGYRTRGAREYRYEPGTSRIEALEFRMRGDRTAEPLRAGLVPAETKGTAASWRVDDLRTEAPIGFAFRDPIPFGENVDRAMQFSPLALLIFAAGAFLVRAPRAAAATIGFGVGLAGLSVLRAYLPPVTALATGAILGALLGAIVLGTKRGAFVALAGALFALVPTLTGHATLAVWALSLLIVGAVVGRPRELPVRNRAYVA